MGFFCFVFLFCFLVFFCWSIAVNVCQYIYALVWSYLEELGFHFYVLKLISAQKIGFASWLARFRLGSWLVHRGFVPWTTSSSSWTSRLSRFAQNSTNWRRRFASASCNASSRERKGRVEEQKTSENNFTSTILLINISPSEKKHQLWKKCCF